jgi:hypothetical protein
MITTTKKDTSSLDFVQYRVSGDSARYIGPGSTDIVTEDIICKSAAPKRGNNQYGNRKSSVNLIRGTSVVDLEGSTVVRDRQLAVSGSMPVGTTLADLLEDAHQLGVLLQDANFVEQLFYRGVIEL